MTLERIKEIISEEVSKLNKIGFYPVEIKHVEIVKAISFFADAWITLNKIRVSFYFLEASEDEIRSTLMHELIHMIPESGNGHGKQWKSIADKVNFYYPQYSIKRLGSQLTNGSEFALRSAALKGTSLSPRKIIRVQCQCCGTIFERSRESNMTLHPNLYKCCCGGSLKRL